VERKRSRRASGRSPIQGSGLLEKSKPTAGLPVQDLRPSGYSPKQVRTSTRIRLAGAAELGNSARDTATPGCYLTARSGIFARRRTDVDMFFSLVSFPYLVAAAVAFAAQGTHAIHKGASAAIVMRWLFADSTDQFDKRFLKRIPKPVEVCFEEPGTSYGI